MQLLNIGNVSPAERQAEELEARSSGGESADNAIRRDYSSHSKMRAGRTFKFRLRLVHWIRQSSNSTVERVRLPRRIRVSVAGGNERKENKDKVGTAGDSSRSSEDRLH